MKSCKKTVTLICLCLVGVLAAQENVLKNPEFKLWPYSSEFSSRFTPWWSNVEFITDSGYKSEKSVKTTLKAPVKDKVQLSQEAEVKEAGKYIMSVNFKQDAKVERVRLLRLVQVAGKEDDYQVVTMEKDDLPEPGKWGRLIAELDLPAGQVVFAYQAFYNDSAGGKAIWFDNPQVIKKLEE